ncbi:MAG: metallophosphoesterase [Treponema sp.]|nr:metallophosphoesterase [Treponema sp.]
MKTEKNPQKQELKQEQENNDCLNLKACLEMNELPSHNFLSILIDKAATVLEDEITDYRPLSTTGCPGSLLDFSGQKADLPVVLVPDIHARPDFLKNILNYSLPPDFFEDIQDSTGLDTNNVNSVDFKNLTIEKALSLGMLRIICVGDAIHTELTAPHWSKIQAEFDSELFTGPEMQKEMKNCLSVLCSIMTLKRLYPQHFHFIKGNHENILNENSCGDYAFCKYADEGQMVKSFICNFYGDDILYLISCWENALPLAANGKRFVVSHAEPAQAFSRQQLIDARLYEDVVAGLIWTRNGQVKDNTAKEIMKELLEKENIDDAFYFAGHSPIHEKYKLRQKGKLVQFHNPREQNIILFVDSDKKIFNPEKDIIGVDYGRE